MKVFAVSGFKHTGKTTLVSKLVYYYTSLGYKVATIKHEGHYNEYARGDNDTSKHLHSGAVSSVIFNDQEYMLIEKRKTSLEELLNFYKDYDIVIVEGMKYSNLPKVEILQDTNPVCHHVIAYFGNDEICNYHRGEEEALGKYILEVIDDYE